MQPRLLAIAIFICFTKLSAQTLDTKFPGTNGYVNAILQNGNVVYIGGAFSQVGVPMNSIARFRSNSSTAEDGF
jgi:hypothetical protein